MLTTDAWAGYVIYKYWPEQHVFFDDRYDMYPIAVTAAYNKVLSLQPRLGEGARPVPDQPRGVAPPTVRSCRCSTTSRAGSGCTPTRSPPPSTAHTPCPDARCVPDPHDVLVSDAAQTSLPGGSLRP